MTDPNPPDPQPDRSPVRAVPPDVALVLEQMQAQLDALADAVDAQHATLVTHQQRLAALEPAGDGSRRAG